MNEQELTDTIHKLIDADMIAMADYDADTPCVLYPKDIARRAIERCGVRTHEAMNVAVLVCRILIYREVLDCLSDGKKVGEPIAATLARVRRSFPGLSDETIFRDLDTDWLHPSMSYYGAKKDDGRHH